MNRRPRSYQERALPLSYLGLGRLLVEGAGFEPAKPFRTPDLQSGGFNHSPIPPANRPCGYIFAHSPPRGNPISGLRRGKGLLEPQRGFEPLTCRLQIDCASIAPQGRQPIPRVCRRRKGVRESPHPCGAAGERERLQTIIVGIGRQVKWVAGGKSASRAESPPGRQLSPSQRPLPQSIGRQTAIAKS